MNGEIKLSKFERARVIGERASQIAAGAPANIDVEGMRSAMEIATKEFNAHKTPITIIRTMPNGSIVHVNLYDNHEIYED